MPDPRDASRMPYPCDRSALWTLPILLLLTGCGGAEPECDTIETRQAVLQAVSDDHNNPLVAFAERDSTMKAALKDSKPLYQLGQKIVTTAAKDGKQTLQCSGGISVSVGDTKATKEIEFSVQRSSDGNISVAVVPFQF
jgi:hypothetical protein